MESLMSLRSARVAAILLSLMGPSYAQNNAVQDQQTSGSNSSETKWKCDPALRRSPPTVISSPKTRLHRQATVGPQLPFAAEPVGRLHQGQQQCGSQRTNQGNLAQYLHSLMFPALG